MGMECYDIKKKNIILIPRQLYFDKKKKKLLGKKNVLLEQIKCNEIIQK